MTFDAYKQLFEDILNGQHNAAPYDTAAFHNYVKLNQSRMKRWAKQAVIDEEIEQLINGITRPQRWIIITEPWCGDAANSLPFFEKMAALNPLIDVVIQLRDSDSEIDNYLSNGGRAIPILIARDEQGKDLFVWGPRPAPAQELVIAQKSATISQEEKYATILQWYKEDKGQTLQTEIKDLLASISE